MPTPPAGTAFAGITAIFGTLLPHMGYQTPMTVL